MGKKKKEIRVGKRDIPRRKRKKKHWIKGFGESRE